MRPGHGGSLAQRVSPTPSGRGRQRLARAMDGLTQNPAGHAETRCAALTELERMRRLFRHRHARGLATAAHAIPPSGPCSGRRIRYKSNSADTVSVSLSGSHSPAHASSRILIAIISVTGVGPGNLAKARFNAEFIASIWSGPNECARGTATSFVMSKKAQLAPQIGL
jgi:hypothetical protein